MNYSRKLTLFALLLPIFLCACASSPETEFDLDGTSWILQTLEDHQVLAGTTITLEFKDGRMKGLAGCNEYEAEYEIQSGNTISYGEIMRNIEACLEPDGVMQQEEQYLRILWSVASYRTEGGRLILCDDQGNAVLQYGRMP